MIERDGKELMKMRMDGATIREIAETYGVSYQTVQRKLHSYAQSMVGNKKKVNINKIKYKGIYEYFIENPYESYTSFGKKITNSKNSSFIIKIRSFLTGENETFFTIKQIKSICKIVGKSFEETFEEFQVSNSEED